jgi:hypothetical protein
VRCTGCLGELCACHAGWRVDRGFKLVDLAVDVCVGVVGVDVADRGEHLDEELVKAVLKLG